MDGADLDEVDRAIVRILQEDARHNTNATISDRVGIAPSTVGNRLSRLEDAGVIRGYRPEVDYELAGFPLQVLFVCTAPITRRTEMIDRALEINGVVGVRELMTGRENVHVRVVGGSNVEITRIAGEIADIGLEIYDETLVKTEATHPSIRFDPDE
jgi:DNA-binding Lrp family transcriptional regulator